MFNMIPIFPPPESYFGHEIFLNGAVDLYLLDLAHAVDLDVQSEHSEAHAYPLDNVRDLHAQSPLSYYTCHNQHNPHPYWPPRFGDFREVRPWTVETFTERLETNLEKRQALTVQWRDYDGAQRFKDPTQRCTGIEFVHPRDLSNGTWDKDFVKPFEALERNGTVKNVKH
jgi:hypothetical protein